MSNTITAFVLGLKSACDGKRMSFGLLSLAKFAQDDVLQLHPFICE
jgi:hypothetical protein